MVKQGSSAKNASHSSGTFSFKPKFRPSAAEREKFMSSSIKDMYQPVRSEPQANQDPEDEELDMRKILKDVQRLGSSRMSWKEKKKLENQNVVALGGKPPKKQKVPMTLAKKIMKSEKRREHKMLEQGLILEQFGKPPSHKKMEKRKEEDRVLKASEGHFRNGVLNVHHLLRPTSSSKGGDDGGQKISRGKKNKGKKKGGKKKGKKRH